MLGTGQPIHTGVRAGTQALRSWCRLKSDLALPRYAGATSLLGLEPKSRVRIPPLQNPS